MEWRTKRDRLGAILSSLGLLNPKLYTPVFRGALIGLGIGLTSGCSQYTPPSTINPKVVSTPTQWLTAVKDPDITQSPGPSLASTSSLSTLLTQSQLPKLLDQARQHSPTLQRALADINASLALLIQQESRLWPTLAAQVGASRQKSGTITEQFQLLLELNWDADIWGELAAKSRSQLLHAQRQVYLYQQTQAELYIQIARHWLELLTAQQLEQLSQQRVNNLIQQREIIEAGYLSGLRSALDLTLAKADLANARAQAAQRSHNRTVQSRTLEQLIGHYPGSQLRAHGDLHQTLMPLTHPAPSTLLQRRFDLRAASARLAASNADLTAAYYARFPRLALTAQSGSRSRTPAQLLRAEQMVWTLLANLSAPLFNANRLEAQQQQRQAEAEQALADLAQLSLQAFQQVEAALTAQQYLEETYQQQQTAAYHSANAKQLAFEQYQSGLTDYVNVLTIQRRAFDANTAVLTTAKQRLQNRLDLLLALGGDLPHPLTLSPPRLQEARLETGLVN